MANVINLPTHEQVENIKNEMMAAGGKIAATNGKMYKAKMLDTRLFMTGEGKKHLDDLIIDYRSRFPSVAPYLGIEETNKYHIRDNVYMVMNQSYITFFDMNTRKVLNAYSISALSDPNFSLISHHQNYGIDDKYIYVRGYYGTTVSFGVFDKLTGSWVRSIRANGGSVIAYNSALTSSTIPILNGTMFISEPGLYSYYAFQINFDGSGVPTSFTYKASNPYDGAFQGKALFTDGTYIYDICVAHTSSWTVRKSTYNASTMAFTRISAYTNTTSAPGNTSSWVYVYRMGGIDFALIQFQSNSTLLLIRLDTLAQYQAVLGNAAHIGPTFDYAGGKKFFAQPYSAGAGQVIYGGRAFEAMYEFNMLTDATWQADYLLVPAIQGVGATTVSRTMHLGNQAIIDKGELYLRYENNFSAKLIPMNVIEGYIEEVIE